MKTTWLWKLHLLFVLFRDSTAKTRGENNRFTLAGILRSFPLMYRFPSQGGFIRAWPYGKLLVMLENIHQHQHGWRWSRFYVLHRIWTVCKTPSGLSSAWEHTCDVPQSQTNNKTNEVSHHSVALSCLQTAQYHVIITRLHFLPCYM